MYREMQEDLKKINKRIEELYRLERRGEDHSDEIERLEEEADSIIWNLDARIY